MSKSSVVGGNAVIDSMKYELKVYTSDKNPGQFNMSFVIGLCTFEVCQDDSLTAFDTFYIQTATQTLKDNFKP